MDQNEVTLYDELQKQLEAAREHCSICGVFIPDPIVLERKDCNGSYKLPSGYEFLFCSERCCREHFLLEELRAIERRILGKSYLNDFSRFAAAHDVGMISEETLTKAFDLD